MTPLINCIEYVDFLTCYKNDTFSMEFLDYFVTERLREKFVTIF